MSIKDGRIRLLLVDDHPVVREGLRAMLNTDPLIEVIGEASDGVEALEMAQRLEPHVVSTDIRMPGMDGIELTRLIRAAQPSIAVIVLSIYDSETYVLEALRAGASGYLAKGSSQKLLCHAINAVVNGGTVLGSGLLQQTVRGLPETPRRAAQGAADSPSPHALTDREREVLAMVSQGYANKAIASQMNLAEVTIKKHLQSIFGKLGASDRTHAAIVAVRNGLVN